jgi:hypothetical protein
MNNGERVRVAIATYYGVRWRTGTVLGEHASPDGERRLEVRRDDGAHMFNVRERSVRPIAWPVAARAAQGE